MFGLYFYNDGVGLLGHKSKSTFLWLNASTTILIQHAVYGILNAVYSLQQQLWRGKRQVHYSQVLNLSVDHLPNMTTASNSC